jgi:hypothetical protein
VTDDIILPCIACGVVLESAIPGTPTERPINQPDKGTVFTTHGQYGSTFFDEMTGWFVEITVCDDCLRKNTDRILVGYTSRTSSTRYVDWNEWEAGR